MPLFRQFFADVLSYIQSNRAVLILKRYKYSNAIGSRKIRNHFSSPKNSIAFAVVVSQMVGNDLSMVSASFRATSTQSAGSLERLPFQPTQTILNAQEMSSYSFFSGTNDLLSKLNGAKSPTAEALS